MGEHSRQRPTPGEAIGNQGVTFDLQDGPVGLMLAGRSPLWVIDVARDGDGDTPDYQIVDPLLFSARDELGYAGLRDGATVQIGRGTAGSHRFRFDNGISRRHLSIQRSGTSVMVRDLGSTNGTTVLDNTTAIATLPPASPPYVTTAAHSAPSEKRPTRNEDAYCANGGYGFIGVFDGVGSRPNSDQAAQLARYIANRELRFPYARTPRILGRLVTTNALWEANRELVRQGSTSGTTAAIAKIFTGQTGEPYLVTAHTGDSRIYRLRRGSNRLEMLTLDHGIISHRNPKEAMRIQREVANAACRNALKGQNEQVAFYQRHIITSYLGAPEVNITTATHAIKPGDIILAMTDGISDNCTTDQIRQHLLASAGDNALRALVDHAQEISRNKQNPRHKPDDMTIVAMKVA